MAALSAASSDAKKDVHRPLNWTSFSDSAATLNVVDAAFPATTDYSTYEIKASGQLAHPPLSLSAVVIQHAGLDQ